MEQPFLGAKPGNEISPIVYAGKASTGLGGDGYIITLIASGQNGALKGAPVGDLPGWENRTFMYYDSDIGLPHELSHVILGLLGISAYNGEHSELMVAALAKVASVAGIGGVSANFTDDEAVLMAESIRTLYGVSNDLNATGAYVQFNAIPANYDAVRPHLIAWANGPDGSYENIFNADRDFYELAGLDPEYIPSAYRVGYYFHQDSAAANEDGAWRTYAPDEGGDAQGRLDNLIKKGEDIAWLGNQYANVMTAGNGNDYLDGGAGDDTL
ncbi:MAG: hypothetical protein B7Y40_03430, partial [Gammaproteobacteria bacterium 28-57-27]